MGLENLDEVPWEPFDQRQAEEIDADTDYDRETKQIILDQMQRDHVAVVFLEDGRTFEVFADDMDERFVMRLRGTDVSTPVGTPGLNFHLFHEPLEPGREFLLLEHDEPKPTISRLAIRLKTRAIQTINKNTLIPSDE